MENTYSSNGAVNKILVKWNSFNQKNSDAERKALGLKTLDEIKKRKAEFDAMNKSKKWETISWSVGKDKVVKMASSVDTSVNWWSVKPDTYKPETINFLTSMWGPSITLDKKPSDTTTSSNTTTPPVTNYNTSANRETEIQKNLETITGADKTLLSNQDTFKAKFWYADADQGKKAILDAFYEKNKIAAEDIPPATSTDWTVSSYSKSQEENFKNLSDEEKRMAQVKIDLGNTATKKQQDIIRENLKDSLDKNLITYDEYIKKIQDLQTESEISKKQADVNLAKDIELKRIADSANLATLDWTVGVPESMRIAAVSDVGRKDEAEINAKMEATSKLKDLINTNLSKYALTEKELKEKKAEMETKYKEALNNPELAQILKEAKTLEEAEQAISDWKTSKDKKLFAEREAKDLVKIAAADYSNDWAQSTPDQRKLIAYSTAEQLGISLPKGVIDAIVSQFPNDGPAVRNELQNKWKILESLPTWIAQAIEKGNITLDEAIAKFKNETSVSTSDLSTIGKSNTPGVVKAGDLGTDKNMDITDKYIKSATPSVTTTVPPTPALTDFTKWEGRETQIKQNLETITGSDKWLLTNRTAFNQKFGYDTANDAKKKILDDFFAAKNKPPVNQVVNRPTVKLSDSEIRIMTNAKKDPIKRAKLLKDIPNNPAYSEAKKKAYLDLLN